MNDWIKLHREDALSISPARAMMHPAWLLAVFVLVVNDHILKPAALIEPIAGKLSDFAGLFFFPVLLAAVLQVKTQRGLRLSAAATGAVFALINLSASAAGMFDAFVSTVVPFTTTTDPTDLVALLAIPAGLFVLEPAMKASARSTRRMLETAAAMLGGLASMATSNNPPCDFCNTTEEFSQVSILNKTNELHVLRLRDLRAGVILDCDAVARAPGAYLSDAVFSPPSSWFVQSGQEIPVQQNATGNTGSCSAVLVQSDTVPDMIVFWETSLLVKRFAFDADVPREIPADSETVVLDADYSRAVESEMHDWRERSECGERADLCGDVTLAPLATVPAGTRYFWRSVSDSEQSLHFTRPATASGTIVDVPERCESPTASDGLAWEPPRSSEMNVVSMEEGLDGCHEIKLTQSLDPEAEPFGWWLCAPYEALESMVPSPGIEKRLAVSNIGSTGTFNQGSFEGLQLSVTTLDQGTPVALDFIYVSRGYSLPPEVDFRPTFAPIEGCEPVDAECGQVALPVDVQLDGVSEPLRPGESVSVGEVQPLDIHLVRAEYRPVLDPLCEATGSLIAGLDSEGYIEAVIVRRDAGR